jgi:hypothetical protein
MIAAKTYVSGEVFNMQSMVLINTSVRFWVFCHGHAIVAVSMQRMLSVIKKILALGLLG